MYSSKQFFLRVIPVLLFANDVFSSAPDFCERNLLETYINEVEDLKDIASSHQIHEDSYVAENYENVQLDPVEYDFIVIGSGAAGSAVAGRLSEIPEWKILVLEAGKRENLATTTPKFGPLLYTSPYNWGFTTTSQKTWCLGMEENKCSLLMGKALGGSTAINALLYTRGNREDYEEWARLDLPGWGHADLLPYFKKLENAPNLRYKDEDYHGEDGPLNIENPRYEPSFVHNAIKAGKELGYDLIDYNGRNQIGISIPQVATNSGTRQSAAKAYLKRLPDKPNLFVKTSAQVIKINIDPETYEAISVKYIKNGKLYIAKAKKEIILSAGSIKTPQLLMLSGVGPKRHLEDLGIEVVQDLPVGKVLKDHIGFLGLNFVYNQTQPKRNETADIISYLKDSLGPLTSTGINVVNYVKISTNETETTHPDIELYFMDSPHNEGYHNLRSTRVKKETYDSTWKPIEGLQGFSVTVMQTKPRSSGSLTLKDKDPLHIPSIDPNQLSDKDNYDIEMMLSGVRKALELTNTRSMQELGIYLNSNKVKGCEGHVFESDDYWRCAIRHMSICLSHVSGTAKMGPKTDTYAVVDNELRVYGIGKLRVVDASVIPVSISGHLMGPTVMIGEKAADIIRKEWLS